LVQVSAPRTPCANQARRVGRPDWIKLTLQELRPGLYLRVLEPGVVQAGDTWVLHERLNPGGTLLALNRCYYREFDADVARAFIAMPGLMDYWKERLTEKSKQKSAQR
jgi:MOSC domain-containing protein YiiM